MPDINRDELVSDLGRTLYDKYFGKPAKKPDVIGVIGNVAQPIDILIEETPCIANPQIKETPLEESITEVTLTDLLDYYKSQGLVGEEKTAILQTFGAIHGLCFGIESLSGSGKSYTLDMLVDLLPDEDVYVLQQSSDKAAMYGADKINQAKVLVITELQKSASKTMLENLKALGEGKSAERIVTNPDRTGVLEQKIDGGKAVIYTLAIENWFKKDKELARRFFQLYTDISETQTTKILESIAEREALGTTNAIPSSTVSCLKNHLAQALNMDYEFRNPFAPALPNQMPQVIKTRTFIQHYLDLVQACAKYHAPQRVTQGDTLFVNLEDLYIVHTCYSEQFMKSVLGVPLAGENIVEAIGDSPKTATQVHKSLQQNKIPLAYPVVCDMLKELTEAGYLQTESQAAKDPAYTKAAELDSFERNVNWQHMWDTGQTLMQEHYPDVFEEWRDAQLEDKICYAFNPITRQRDEIATNN